MNARRTGIYTISAIAVVVAVAVFAAIIWRGVGFIRLLGSGQNSSSDPATAPTSDPIDATTADDFYAQDIVWSPCTEDRIVLDIVDAPKDMDAYECATVQAPLDWDDPAGEQITLALAVHRSGRDGAPMLFYNLGGPGGNAVKSLSYQINDNLGDALVDAYDIVAVDPRGVGASTPVICMTDEEHDEYNAGEEVVDDTGLTAEEVVEEYSKTFADLAKGCEELSGDLFRHIDTVSAATDFDMVRAVLDQEEFNYLGYSYGTFLGATYAELFPERVGRFVLDGALDPSLSVNKVSNLQMQGFEDSIRHWVEDCQAASGCPLTGDADAGVRTVAAFLDRLGAHPMRTSQPDRPLTQNLALTAIIGLLYSEDSYSTLTRAMAQALNDDDGSQLLYVADYLNERNDDGSYSSHGTDALIAINNLDYSPEGTIEEWEAEAEDLRERLTVMGRFAGYASAGLEAWPTEHAERGEIHAEGAKPIVVIGTTHDPATPYVMAEALAEQLSSGVLVTNEGWDHTAYSKAASECVTSAVEGYLVDGIVPEDGLTCR